MISYFAGFAKAASSMAALFLISENLRIMVESGERCSNPRHRAQPVVALTAKE